MSSRTITGWVGDDYPNVLPLDLGALVALTAERTAHYAMDGPDAAVEFLSQFPGGDLGFVRLGPQRRLFGVAMYHQMHCLDMLRVEIVRAGERSDDDDWVRHMHHCMSYLRQAILCAADVTLEHEVGHTQDVGQGLGVTHVCRDWSKVYKFTDDNWEDWQRYLNETSSR